MEVVILAGGLGTRLRSVVNDVPKCMAPVAGQPFLYYILKWLSKYPVDRVVLAVGYLREVIEAWVAENKDNFPFQIAYSIEEQPMGTGGGIRLAMNKVEANEAIILNGDTFFDVDLLRFMDEHKKRNSILSVALKPMSKFDRYGSVHLENHVIKAFNEKEYCEEGVINGGIYILNKVNPFFTDLPAKFSFETDVLNLYSKEELVCGFVHDNYFIDIGIPEDYNIANKQFPNLFQ